jgi:hypothetical protein
VRDHTANDLTSSEEHVVVYDITRQETRHWCDLAHSVGIWKPKYAVIDPHFELALTSQDRMGDGAESTAVVEE